MSKTDERTANGDEGLMYICASLIVSPQLAGLVQPYRRALNQPPMGTLATSMFGGTFGKD